MMSAQKSNQTPTLQTTSKGDLQTSPKGERSQQSGLSRQGESTSALPSLWVDPFDLLAANPFSLMRRVQDEINRAFSQAGSNSLTSRGTDLSSTIWVPAIEVSGQDGNFVVTAELPGLTDEDVTVEISDDAIVIQGERQVEQEESDGGIRRTERRYGRFYRAIPLPDGANADDARAEFVNGLLRISVPIEQARSNTRQIPIQSTGSQQSTSSQPSTGTQSSEQASAKSEAPAQKAA
jgi:HSP20 family protein